MERAYQWLWVELARKIGETEVAPLTYDFERRLRPNEQHLFVCQVAEQVAAKHRPTLHEATQLLEVIDYQRRENDRLYTEMADSKRLEQNYARLADDWNEVTEALEVVGISTVSQGSGEQWHTIFTSQHTGHRHELANTFSSPGEALAALIRRAGVTMIV